jgi:hypothetical protein
VRTRIHHFAEHYHLIGALVLAAHGAIHLMGFVLLWNVGQPSGLAYADMRPTPGTPGGEAVGLVWLAAALLFLMGASLLATRRPGWDRFTLAGALVSLPALLAVIGTAATGVALDAVIVASLIIGRAPAARSPDTP